MKRKIICVVCICLIGFSLVFSYANIPDSFILYKDKEWSSGSISDVLIKNESIEVSRGLVVAKKEGSYQAALSFLGIPYKSVTLNVIDQEEVIAGGQAIGIRIYSDGLLVIATGRVNENEKSPAEKAGIQPGDTITKVNSQKIESLEEFSEMIENSQEVELEIKHGEEIRRVLISPEVSKRDGVRRIGLWVRDSTAGVGTLTYTTLKGPYYGALGHAVSDVDTGKRFEILTGTIEKCAIGDIKKGEKGSPGELKGVFYSGAEVLGDIKSNKTEGIFGMFIGSLEGEKIKTGHRNEIEKGKAYMRTSLDGETVKSYEIEILKVSKNTKNPTKGMIIKVTDEELIEKTGGIVQGMSGSPIIQNGKLIGAVTHVLVNDPTKGYGIFIENMLNAAK